MFSNLNFPASGSFLTSKDKENGEKLNEELRSQDSSEVGSVQLYHDKRQGAVSG